MNLHDIERKYFTKDQKKQIDEFKLAHKECRDSIGYQGLGAADCFSYIFTHGSIGDYNSIICSVCNTKEDITDVDVW